MKNYKLEILGMYALTFTACVLGIIFIPGPLKALSYVLYVVTGPLVCLLWDLVIMAKRRL